ncbi:MAG: DUF1844 domain-containing protein [bacterium]|nr:DUF1844 domain-containing protein [bacterium]
MANESEEHSEGQSFKVSDRRFSIRGYEDEEVAGADSAPESVAAPSPPPAPEPAAAAREEVKADAPPPQEAEADEASEQGAEASGREFEMLMAILQGNALAAMGLNPQSGERLGAPDQRAARLFVDIVEMVKRKMGPNLSPEEEGLINHLLSDLQMLYVREVGIGG